MLMKNYEKEPYDTPEIEVVELIMEMGFATSGGTEGFGNSDGSWE